MVNVTDPVIVAAQRDVTGNHHPEIPIEVWGIDYAVLGRLSPPSFEDAPRSVAR